MKFLNKSVAASAFVFLLMAAASPWWSTESSAYSVPSCAAPSGVSSVPMQNAPAALIDGLKEEVGDIAAPNEEFTVGDVVEKEPYRNRRIAFIWNAGNRWVIGTEAGGIGYSNPVFAFELRQDNQFATLVQEITAGPETLCAVASDLIGAKRRPPE